MGDLKANEARYNQGQVTSEFTYGDQRVLIERTTDSTGAPRTVFAVMSYDDGLGWYPAETVDRPRGGGFTWAQVTLADGQRIFAWDRLPAGKSIYVQGSQIDSTAGAGSVPWDSEIGDETTTSDSEVVVK